MLVFKTDGLIQGEVRFLNRDIYLASVLKKNLKIRFCVNKEPDFSQFFRKKGISWCLDKDFFNLKDENLKSIIWDVKHFHQFDLDLLKWAKKNRVKTVQITDLGLNQQPVDYTIDSSLVRNVPYENEKRGLFGLEYVILHHKYRHFNRIRRLYRKNIKNIFISLSEELDYRYLRNIIDFFHCRNYKLKLHFGPTLKKSHKKILKRLYSSICFVGKVDCLARSFFEADIAIVSAGELAYKAAACGTPSFYVCMDKNQEFLADSLESREVGYKIKNLEDLYSPALIDRFNTLPYEKRKEMGRLGKELVDAKGIYRIIDFFQKEDIIYTKNV